MSIAPNFGAERLQIIRRLTMITVHCTGSDNKRYVHVCSVSRLGNLLVELHGAGCSIKFVSRGA